MRHARAEALDELEPMLRALRAVEELSERSRGVFYRSGEAFLHFHEDPSGHHVDVRFTEEFERHRVATAAEQDAVITRVVETVSP